MIPNKEVKAAAKLLGSLGGKKTAAKMPKEALRERARKAGQARAQKAKQRQGGQH